MVVDFNIWCKAERALMTGMKFNESEWLKDLDLIRELWHTEDAEHPLVGGEDHGRDQRIDRQPGAAGDHGQRQHRDQPVPRVLDGTGRHDRRNSARES